MYFKIAACLARRLVLSMRFFPDLLSNSLRTSEAIESMMISFIFFSMIISSRCSSLKHKSNTVLEVLPKWLYFQPCMSFCLLTLTVLVKTLDALGHFETG